MHAASRLAKMVVTGFEFWPFILRIFEIDAEPKFPEQGFLLILANPEVMHSVNSSTGLIVYCYKL